MNKIVSFFKQYWKIVAVSFSIMLLLVGIACFYIYTLFFAGNINCNKKSYFTLYVPHGATWQSVTDSLNQYNLIKDCSKYNKSFDLMVGDKTPKAGRYDIEPNLGNRAFINRVGYGLSNKTPFKISMTRYTTWVVRNMARQIEADSASLADYFLSDSVLEANGVTRESSMAQFVRFDDKINWAATPSEVGKKIKAEYDKVWNEERLKLAKDMNFTPVQVHILASIVEEETNLEYDRRMVAGVYMNRLARRMPLQACPTARYASGDFTLNRILKIHTQIDSPYNTYQYAGLPPGPIRIPSIESIDAVLHYEHHKFLYFCAKADFSGTHNYAVTLSEHNRNAAEYQRELNRRGIGLKKRK